MNPLDSYYQRAMRDLYGSAPHLNAIEQVALLPIRVRWEQGDSHDHRWVSAVGELREDGMTVCAPLTLSRLDAYLLEFERTGKTTIFSMRP